MRPFGRRYPWRAVAFAAAICTIAYAAAAAKDSDPAKATEQHAADEDPKAALITLKNAIRKSPQDPALHVKIARLYLQAGDVGSAEREARTVRDLKGDEADYLPVLIDALLRQGKFKDLYDMVEPGDREPVLEGKVRTALGAAAARLGYDTRAEALLRDAIKLDPSVIEPWIQLARFLNKTRPDEAGRVIDDAIAANPKSAEPLREKGEKLWSRGDADEAVRLFSEALEIDPDYKLARIGRANVNVARGDFAAADMDLDLILQSTPNNFMANYLRGVEYVKQQNYSAADRVFSGISAAFPAFPYGYYVQGATKFALEQFGAAEKILAEYLRRVPRDPNATRLIARAALLQHGAARAIDYLRSLAEESKPDPATLTLLGNAYLAEDKPDAALQQFDKAITLDPDNTKLKIGRGIAEINSGRAAQGLAQLEQVFLGDAEAAVAGPTLVLAELRAGQVDKAAEVVNALIERDPDNSHYQILMGKVRVAQRDYAGAETVFRATASRDPDFADALRDLAQLYAVTGRTDDAKRVYGDILSKAPADTIVLLGLAAIAAAEKNWSEAVEFLNRARAAAAFDPIPGLKLIALYELRRDWNSAKAVATELNAQFPRDGNVVVALGRTQLESGDINAAVSSYKVAHQLAPNSITIQTAYVNLLKQAKYFPEAREALQEAINRNPQNVTAKAELIRVESEINGLDSAVSKAREFTASDPGNSLYDIVTAELYEEAGRDKEAVTLLENRIAARPAAKDLTPALSRLYIRMGMPAKAEAFLKARLKAEATDTVARSELAYYYMREGKGASAIAEYSRFIEDHPADPTALNNLAWLYQRRGELGKAREFAERAFTVAPRDASINDTLGWILLSQGDVKGAIDRLDTASLGAPQNPSIQFHLATALRRVGRASDARTVLETLLGSGTSFADKGEAEKLFEELKLN